MSYSNLTIKELYQIDEFVLEGYSVRKIAFLMKVHPSTISRELKRSPEQYSDERAQLHDTLCCTIKGRRTIFTASMTKTMKTKTDCR